MDKESSVAVDFFVVHLYLRARVFFLLEVEV